MSAADALAVLLALGIAVFCLVVNMKARNAWLKWLSLLAMISFAALAGYRVVQALLFGGGAA